MNNSIHIPLKQVPTQRQTTTIELVNIHKVLVEMGTRTTWQLAQTHESMSPAHANVAHEDPCLNSHRLKHQAKCLKTMA